MSFYLRQFSIVVVAKSHNPTILNPDFLRLRNIINKDEEIADTLTSQPVSFVRLRSGVEILVQSEKLQLSIPCKGNMPAAAIIPEIADQYINTLQHIRYSQVGINFTGHIEKENSGLWIKESFLKEIKIFGDAENPVMADVKLFQQLNDCLFGLVISKAELSESKQEVALLDANYHFDLKSYPADLEAKEKIGLWKSKLDHYMQIVEKIEAME